MMKLYKKFVAVMTILVLAVILIASTVYANISISDLHDSIEKKELSILSDDTDVLNTSSILSQLDIYTNQAISDQYKVVDEKGSLLPTKMSDLIDAASVTVKEKDENGKSIVEPIPTVSEILSIIDPRPLEEYETEFGYHPDDLNQLTYMLDFKYTSTDYRVIRGDEIKIENRTEILENGMIHIRLHGGEILRCCSKDDFVIIQVEPVTEKVYLFSMTEYDEKTGDYEADFPCIGPYMITQIIK